MIRRALDRKVAGPVHAKRDGTSINQFVTMAAAEKLAALDTEDYFRSRVQRADLQAFDRIMNRTGGVPPREGDER